MNIDNSFSYDNYKKILNKYKSSNVDYLDCFNAEEFSLIRHDVEFSMSRALLMAKIDYSIDIESTFLFQVKSQAYNLCSNLNKEIVNRISDLKRKIGLHLYISHLEENDWDSLEKELKLQSAIFESSTGIKVKRFSFHRPPKWVLKNRNDWLFGYLNLYGESFFEFSDSPKNIKYIADSQHKFNYGDPLDNHDFRKYQILLHPDEWTEVGYEDSENFKSLEFEHNMQFKNTLNSETKHYAKYYEK